MNNRLIVDFLSQAGLPLIKAGIEEAWLEGRGELTDDQVGIFDKVQSITFPFSGDGFELCVLLVSFLEKVIEIVLLLSFSAGWLLFLFPGLGTRIHNWQEIT